MRKRDNFVFAAFALSLILLFLQQFYFKNTPASIIHAIDILILLFVISETFFAVRQEKYIRKYFQNNLVDFLAVLIFALTFIIFKIQIGFKNISEELSIVFDIFKNIFLFGKIIRLISKRAGLTAKIISNPARTLIISFFMVIIIGSFLLMLPAASAKESPLNFLTALFTSASAVCVTGLSVIDVSSELTIAGKFILIVLIQVGGLGIMVFSFFGMLAFRKKMTVSEKLTISYMVSEDDMSNLFKTLRVIVLSTFFIEALSAVFLFIGFSRILGFNLKTLGFALFHAISAFCNAGFALFSNNLESFTSDIIISLTIGFTIILGGISFAVIYDVLAKVKTDIKNKFLKKKKTDYLISVNTKMILSLTVFILFISFALFYLLEHRNTMKEMSLGTQYLASFFQAITLRTAGFSTVSFLNLTNATLLFMIFIMFMGGAAGSTAGGIKLNTIAVVFAFFKSFLKNQKTVVIKNVSVPEEQVKKAFLIFGFGLAAISVGIFLLTITESLPFLALLFETVSAFATVGLSTGITSALSPAGKIVIIILMFIGRVGPLTFLTAAGKKQKNDDIEYPYGNIAIG